MTIRKSPFLLAIGLLMVLSLGKLADAQSVSPPTIKPNQKLLNQLREQSVAAQMKLQALKREKLSLVKTIESVEARMQSIAEEESKIVMQQEPLGISQESFPEVISMLQTQRIQLRIDLAGLNAKREALQQARVESRDQASGDIAQELAAMVAKQEKRLVSLVKLREAKTVSSDDVDRAEYRLLEAKIRLKEAKAPSSTDSLLQSALIEVALDIAEREARLSKTLEILEGVAPKRKSIDDLGDMQAARKELQQRLASYNYQMEVIELKRQAAEEEVGLLNEMQKEMNFKNLP